MGRSFEVRKKAMAKTQGAKSKVYSRYGKEIYVCAKSGGADPGANLSLRSLMDRAKKDQVPTHVIDKALEKARGGGGEDYVSVRFEGFGPNNSLVIVDCLTDNNNRTFGDVRQCFTKAKCKLGAQGAVAHMFDHRAVLSFNYEDEEAVLEALMEADVDVADIENEDGMITVFAPTTEYFKAKSAISALIPNVEFEMDEITFIPQTVAEITDPEEVATMDKLINLLNDCDDVQNIYHNAQFDE